MLDALAWQPYYSEAFELYKEQGECEFLSGHFDRSEQLLAIALENARSQFDKAAIYVIKIAQLGAGINLTFIIFWQPQVATWGYDLA